LEARWAVFFDALGLKWEYEPEGFVLPSGRHYLPDFRVTIRDQIFWFEIKPGDEGENELFTEFMEASPAGWAGSVLNEIPDPRLVAEKGYYYDGSNYDRPYIHWSGHPEDGGGWDNFRHFCICESCGAIGYQFDGRSARIGCGCAIHNGSDRNHTTGHPRIIAAFTKARRARFEHDQSEKW
jgi:hypothetical protein